MPYEIDDQSIRLIGYNVPIKFFNPAHQLKAEIYLQTDDTLNIGGVSSGPIGGTEINIGALLGGAFVIVGSDANLSNARTIAAGGGVKVADGGPGGLVLVSVRPGDGLDIAMNNDLAIGEGPGIDVTEHAIGLGLDLPLLSHGDGSPAEEYATFALALAAASADDSIGLPPGEYVGPYTIGAGVSVIGLSRNDVILTGQITVHGALINVTVDRDEDEVDPVVGVQLEDGGVVSDCTLRVVNATGDAYGIYAEGDVTAYAYRLLFDLDAGGDAYGAYADGAEVYVEHSAFLPGTTYVPVGVAQ